MNKLFSIFLLLFFSNSFTVCLAGDFPVKILEITGNGSYTGRGYIVVPYLADTKLAVEFNSITVNTDYQLINCIVETTYNPDWTNVMSTDTLLDDVFGSEATYQDDVSSNDPIGTETVSGNSGGETSQPGNGTVDPGEDPSTEEPPTEEPPTEEPPGEEPPGEEPPGEEPPGEETGSNDYFVRYNEKNYKNNEKIAIPFNRNTLSNIKFEMVDLEDSDNVKYELSYKSDLGNRFDKIEGNNYMKKGESTEKVVFDLTYDNTLKYKLKSIAQIDKEPSILNDVELIV